MGAEPLSDEIVQKAIRYAQSGTRAQEDRDFLASVVTLLQYEWRLANEQVINQMMRVEMVEAELHEATRLIAEFVSLWKEAVPKIKSAQIKDSLRGGVYTGLELGPSVDRLNDFVITHAPPTTLKDETS